MRNPLRRRLPASYEEQTHASPYAIVRIPHRVRYRTAARAIEAAAPSSLLDYGAGDGKLLIDAIRSGLAAETIVAYEPVERYAELLAERLGAAGVAGRVRIVGERGALAGERFEFITCLGVLEHMPLPEREAFYALCEETLAPEGTILIDVPVEVGPSLVVKSLARMALKGRRREYGWRELARLGLGGEARDPDRHDPGNRATWIQDHKGFDYRVFQRELEGRFAVTERTPTPFRRLPPPLGNQEVFFTARRHGR